MAWNQMAASPLQQLHKIKGWAAKGLPYWQARYAACQRRIYTADSSGQLGRAIKDRDIAEAAVLELGGTTIAQRTGK